MIRRLLAFFGIVKGGCCDADCDDCSTEWHWPEDVPIGYDGWGAPIYSWQEGHDGR